MTKVQKLLQVALKNQDWEKVKEAVETLKKEAKEKPKAKENPEPSVDVDALRDKILAQLKEELRPKEVQSKSKSRGKKGEDEVNRFIDKLDTATDLIDDSRKQKPVHKERRGSYKPVKVVCAGCGKQEMVHPDLRPVRIERERSHYRCQSCIRKNQVGQVSNTESDDE